MFTSFDTLPRQQKWQYHAVPLSEYSTDLGLYESYGIWLTGADCDRLIHDVTTDGDAAHNLAAAFTRNQLSPLHFFDAIEDFLA